MSRIAPRHKCLVRLAFLVAFTLVIAGIRIPDLAHPNRPKPLQRALVETQLKAFELDKKKVCDTVAVVAPALLVAVCTFRMVHDRVATPSPAPAPTFPPSSRAPPRFLRF